MFFDLQSCLIKFLSGLIITYSTEVVKGQTFDIYFGKMQELMNFQNMYAFQI